MVAWNTYYAAATGIGAAEQVPVVAVTSGFQAVTGVAPMMGRGFVAARVRHRRAAGGDPLL